MHFVALLRGINVGGNNPVPMRELKALCEGLGWTDVRTYINSGNVVFSADGTCQALASALEAGIRERFGFPVSVLVLTAEHMERIGAELPADWVKSATMRTDVMFLWPEMDHPGIIDLLGPKAVDRVRHVPGAVLWNVLDADYNRSALNNLVGTKTYKAMTVRNVNTFRALLALLRG